MTVAKPSRYLSINRLKNSDNYNAGDESVIVVLAWEVKQANGRWRRLRWKMDEAFAASYTENNGVELIVHSGSMTFVRQRPLSGKLESAGSRP